MALKSGLFELQSWSYEKDEDPKTVFYARGMSKGEYDEWIMRTASQREESDEITLRDRIVSKSQMYRVQIKKIENAVYNDKMQNLEDAEEIGLFIDTLTDIEAGTALDEWLTSLNELSEEDKKKSDSQSE